MPFTLSHAAAALPFSRTKLVVSALVVGTFAPDLEYFIRLDAGGGWGHTLPGAFAMDLPLGLAALWAFHRLVKIPSAYLLPDGLRARLAPHLAPFRFGPWPRFLLILLSMLIGISTHLLWDGFTHPQYWIVRHWEVLEHIHRYPMLGWHPNYAILQLVSSLLGLAVLAVWCGLWLRRSAALPAVKPNPLTSLQRAAILVLGCVFAILGSLLRAWLSVGVPRNHVDDGNFIQQVVVTFGALCWWQLALWGLVAPFRHAGKHAAPGNAQWRPSLQQ